MDRVFFPRTAARTALAVRLPVVAVRRAEEALVVAAAVFCYFLVRGLVDGRQELAFAHAADLIALERRLGVFWEPALQEWALARPPLPTAMNWVYIWGHWPVVAGTLLWLLVCHRAAFPLYRTALLVSGAIGLVGFATYPVAPPRLVEGWGFVDTVTLHSEAYRVLQPPSLTNQYAAMPSLHFGWNLLVGIAVARHAARPAAKLFGVLMPLAMLSAVVLTANHYVLDAFAGGALALVGLAAAQSFARALPTPSVEGSRAGRPTMLLHRGSRRGSSSLRTSPPRRRPMRRPVGHPAQIGRLPDSPANMPVATSDVPPVRGHRGAAGEERHRRSERRYGLGYGEASMDNRQATAAFDRVMLPLTDARDASSVRIVLAATLPLLAPGATLLLLGILPSASASGDDRGAHKRRLRALLDDVEVSVCLDHPDLAVETVIRAGEASDQIDAAVRERGIGLVVLSAEADMTSGGGVSLWPGSPITKVLHAVTAPVVVVPQLGLRDVASVPAPRRLIVPLDGSDLAIQALPLAESLAGRLGLAIHLLTVIDPDQVLPASLAREVRPGTAQYGEVLAGLQVDLQRRLDRTVSRLRSAGIAATAELRWGPAATCIAGVAGPGDVIVLSSHGRGGARWPLGSVAAEVLRASRVPVVVHRAEPPPELVVATYEGPASLASA